MMKKMIFCCVMAAFGMGQVSAQDVDDLGIFNHLGAGIGVGTTGISIDVAAPISPYVAVRAGMGIFPTIKVKTDLDLDFDNATREAYNQTMGHYPENEVAVEGKTSMTTGHLLFDIFPFKTSSFHFTAGAYFGGSKIVKVNNRESGVLNDIYTFNSQHASTLGVDRIGVDLGDYFLEPDANGNVKANIKVNGFRPYLGVGFGRPVPMKHRVTCNFDMGVQFWGKPKVYAEGLNGETQLTESDTNGKDGGAIKTISKIAVWPVLNVRVAVRLF
ncbi:MAG: hypothetical protein IJ633_07430 [Prevotella sp.]|nr:hypothetical protein [Prevotella sp.]